VWAVEGHGDAINDVWIFSVRPKQEGRFAREEVQIGNAPDCEPKSRRKADMNGLVLSDPKLSKSIDRLREIAIEKDALEKERLTLKKSLPRVTRADLLATKRVEDESLSGE
jgi:hypothetical protein